MKKKDKKALYMLCPIEKTLEILGRKHTTLIIRDLLSGKKRFGELKKNMPFISTKTLSERLDFLEKERIIKRKVFNTIPLKVEYSLTNLGETLEPIINQMREWGEYKLNITSQN